MEDVVWLALIAFTILVVLALILGVGIFLFTRFRAGMTVHISMRFLLRLYLYVIVIVGLLLFTQGLSELLKAGLAGALDKDFSYRPAHIPTTPEEDQLHRQHPLEIKQQNQTLTPAEQDELDRYITFKNQRLEELREERRVQGLDRALEEGLIEGVSFAVIGAIIWILHVLGRRWLETPEERIELINRIYLILVVVTFGAITIVNLPQAISEGVTYYLTVDPSGEFGHLTPPGDKLALSVVALPIWITYLFGTIRTVRQGE